MTEGDEAYARIVTAARTDPEVPEGLLFWVTHQRYAVGSALWHDCPRGDWLLWMAEALGYQRSYVQQIRMEMTERMENVRGSPFEHGVTFVRTRISWVMLQQVGNRLQAVA